jgi:hypothetical protein
MTNPLTWRAQPRARPDGELVATFRWLVEGVTVYPPGAAAQTTATLILTG